MTDLDLDDDHTGAWLVEATRGIDEPTDDVRRLISSITGNLGRVRRPGRPIASDDPGIRFNDRVIKQLIATRIRSLLGSLAVYVAVDGDDLQITGLRIGLVAHYHDDLPALSDDIRDLVDEVLTGLLGSPSGPRAPIAIRWQDVYTREWRQA